MKIVIEIEEAVYKACIPYKDTPIISSLANYNSEMTYAIANGTPLPKEHGDLISRDYVLSKFKEQCDRCGKYKENNGVMCRCCALDDAIDYVEDAPSIFNGAENTDGDLVSRTDLLKELEKWDWQELYLPIHFKELVADLPSAEKTAEWIVKTNSNGTYGVCSNCRKEQCAGLLNYCPYCGARMKGESEEEE